MLLGRIGAYFLLAGMTLEFEWTISPISSMDFVCLMSSAMSSSLGILFKVKAATATLCLTF